MMKTAFGDEAMSRARGFEWFRPFKEGRQSVNSDPVLDARPPLAMKTRLHKTATAGSVVVQSGRPIFDDFFQHLWPYIGNNTANVVL
ncbi:hypothetical protein TNCV_3341031 [Trichonephila clavipes]|nr:hypothetical protein TNCV_3341031 [Trichonephila clavipes]